MAILAVLMPILPLHIPEMAVYTSTQRLSEELTIAERTKDF
jgi:hypothetical protein